MLLECALALPLAIGLFVTPVSRLLCLSMFLEAFSAWQWWGSGFPSWHYQAHVREHFFLNMATSGGLLLMQSFGPGMFSVDQALAKQD
jgi:uncharacterized membrane protein YphA (DoxX/SURF4 family)